MTSSWFALVPVKQPWRILVDISWLQNHLWYNYSITNHCKTVCKFYAIYSILYKQPTIHLQLPSNVIPKVNQQEIIGSEQKMTLVSLHPDCVSNMYVEVIYVMLPKEQPAHMTISDSRRQEAWYISWNMHMVLLCFVSFGVVLPVLTAFIWVVYQYSSGCPKQKHNKIVCIFYGGCSTTLLILFRAASLQLGQSYDCPSGSEVTLKNIGEIMPKYAHGFLSKALPSCGYFISFFQNLCETFTYISHEYFNDPRVYACPSASALALQKWVKSTGGIWIK